MKRHVIKMDECHKPPKLNLYLSDEIRFINMQTIQDESIVGGKTEVEIIHDVIATAFSKDIDVRINPYKWTKYRDMIIASNVGIHVYKRRDPLNYTWHERHNCNCILCRALDEGHSLRNATLACQKGNVTRDYRELTTNHTERILIKRYNVSSVTPIYK